MEIFKGRPMAVVGLLSLSAAAAVYFGGIPIASAIAAIAVIAALTAFLLFRKGKIGTFRLICAAVLFAAILSVTASAVCFTEYKQKKALSLCGDGKELTGTVIRRDSSTGYSSSFEIRITSVDNKKLKNVSRAKLYCEYPSDLQPGFDFYLKDAEILPVEDVFGVYAGNYVADGNFLSVTSYSDNDCTVTGEGRGDASAVLTGLNSELARILTEKVGGDEGELAAAMLLRNTDGITSEIRRDFNRAGLSHLLAVSGLHISIMTGILAWILARLGLHRSFSTVLLAVFSLAYLAVLGYPFSAVRSVIMLFIVYGVYFAGFDTDGMNSLGIALTLIVIAFPASFLDSGFVLSFCATAGIVSLLPEYENFVTAKDNRRTEARVREERKKKREIAELASVDPAEAEKEKEEFRREKKVRRHLRNAARTTRDKIFGAVIVSLASQMLTLLPMSLYDGTISRALLPSNLILCPLAAAVIFLSALFLPFSSVPYISGFLAYYLRSAASLLLSAVSFISEKRNVSVSLSTPFATALIITATVATVILMTVKLRYRSAVIVPSLCAVLILCFVPVWRISGGTEIRYVCDTERKSDAIIVCDGENGIFASEMSPGSFAFLSDISRIAYEKGHTEIEVLMLTHYHVRHESAVEKFMRSEKVRTLLIPAPVTEGDLEVFWKLCEAARECGTRCLMYGSDERFIFCPGISIGCSGPLRIGRSTHPVFSVSVCVDANEYLLPDGLEEYRISLLSASAWDDETGSAVEAGKNADCLVIAIHGPVCKTVPAFEVTDPGLVLLSDASASQILLHPDGSIAALPDPGNIRVGCGIATFYFRKK